MSRHRYHATGACKFDAESIKQAIDKSIVLMAERIGHGVRLVNIVTTTHPSGGEFMLITIIAEDQEDEHDA